MNVAKLGKKAKRSDRGSCTAPLYERQRILMIKQSKGFAHWKSKRRIQLAY